MPVEDANYIDGLDQSSPKSGEPKAQGDNHIRLLKKVLLACFPNIKGPMLVAHDQVASLTDIANAQMQTALPGQAGRAGLPLVTDGTNSSFQPLPGHSLYLNANYGGF